MQIRRTTGLVLFATELLVFVVAPPARSDSSQQWIAQVSGATADETTIIQGSPDESAAPAPTDTTTGDSTVIQNSPDGDTVTINEEVIPIDYVRGQTVQYRRTITTKAGLDGIALNRAKNLARQAAERVNGGLSYYRAEPAMHGNVFESPFTISEEQDLIVFVFKGYHPSDYRPDVGDTSQPSFAYEPPYSYQSVVAIDIDSGDIDVLYNGALDN
ncbi:hypothetical protein KR51_00028830 [Rubidibacter lacunae KORDI 51-2]|uniref:Uncharacterized protein n=1 Tax=Rubidibacter lacunae KORDI 51-2 TaxID=582515 RepID=U5DJ83_9CHRO|nr:hypothetical protein [Rubidibacter lacunae]ERN40624.1 hypothetical protein KR51_00028830 [Rubidibacter lacunae KORDI 51-2]